MTTQDESLLHFFRDLNPEEDKRFRQWARENFSPDVKINELWHPVVNDEISKIQQLFDNLRMFPKQLLERLSIAVDAEIDAKDEIK